MACCKSTGFSPKVLAQIRQKLAEIEDVFPGVQRRVVLTRGGDVVTTNVKGEELKQEEDVHPLISLKRSAVDFANAMLQDRCPVVHVRGLNTTFSCYDVGADWLLAFYCEAMSSTAAEFDTDAADERMHDSLLPELRLLLEGLVRR